MGNPRPSSESATPDSHALILGKLIIATLLAMLQTQLYRSPEATGATFGISGMLGAIAGVMFGRLAFAGAVAGCVLGLIIFVASGFTGGGPEVYLPMATGGTLAFMVGAAIGIHWLSRTSTPLGPTTPVLPDIVPVRTQRSAELGAVWKTIEKNWSPVEVRRVLGEPDEITYENLSGTEAGNAGCTFTYRAPDVTVHVVMSLTNGVMEVRAEDPET